MAGSSLLGATGAVLALPFIATTQAVMDTYVERHRVIESELVERRTQERGDEPESQDSQATDE